MFVLHQLYDHIQIIFNIFRKSWESMQTMIQLQLKQWVKNCSFGALIVEFLKFKQFITCDSFFECWDTDGVILILAEDAIEVSHAAANRWTGSTLYAFFQQILFTRGEGEGMVFTNCHYVVLRRIPNFLAKKYEQTTFSPCGNGVQTTSLRPRSSLKTCIRRSAFRCLNMQRISFGCQIVIWMEW